MPIEARKVKDILRNQQYVREALEEDIETYRDEQDNTQFENGLLTYVNEVAYGDLRELLKDVGVNKETINFTNVADYMKIKETRVHPNDRQSDNLRRARFTSVDMTDYENDFTGCNEINGGLPIMMPGKMAHLIPELWPQTNALMEEYTLEQLPKPATSKTIRERHEERAAEAEAEEEEDEDDEEDEDEDEEEEGEEGEGDEEEEEEEDDEEEEEGMPENYDVRYPQGSNKYWDTEESVRKRFNEVELDGFMKLLNIKPVTQWQDDTVYHYKLGMHTYEDEPQQLDPYFHLLAEVERKHLDRQQVYKFREGSEIKFVMDKKKKPNFGGR